MSVTSRAGEKKASHKRGVFLYPKITNKFAKNNPKRPQKTFLNAWNKRFFLFFSLSWAWNYGRARGLAPCLTVGKCQTPRDCGKRENEKARTPTDPTQGPHGGARHRSARIISGEQVERPGPKFRGGCTHQLPHQNGFCTKSFWRGLGVV